MTGNNEQNANFLTEELLTKRLPVWCEQLGIETQNPIQLNRPALLILDMQNEFLTDRGQMPVWGGPAVISGVRSLLEEFRKARLPVFFSRHICIEPYRHRGQLAVMDNVTQPSEFLAEGSYGSELHDLLPPLKHEQVIKKYSYSAFYDTALDTFLRINEITDVIITGVATNICCEATAHDAFFRGFNVFFSIDGCGGTDENAHLATLKNISLVYGKLVTLKNIVETIKYVDSQEAIR